MDDDHGDIGSRCGALFTKSVDKRTTIYILRLRYQITVTFGKAGNRSIREKSLLAEECLGVSVCAGDEPRALDDVDALTLLSVEPARNMDDAQKTNLVQKALDALTMLEKCFAEIAQRRARELLDDHRRIREASDAKGIRYGIVPALPVDVIGAYVLNPAASF